MTPAPDDPAPPSAPEAPELPDPVTDPSPGAPGRRIDRPPVWSLLCAAGLVLLISVALVAGWRTLQTHHRAAVVVQDPPALVVPPLPVLSPGPRPTPAPPAPSAHPSPSTPRSTPRPKPSPSTSVQPAVDRSIPVVVLNATSRTGLAARAARSLRTLGWNVASVGNWRGGGVGRTTVFATGYALAARTLRADVGVSSPVRPSLSSMPTSRLVLVLGYDYRS